MDDLCSTLLCVQCGSVDSIGIQKVIASVWIQALVLM